MKRKKYPTMVIRLDLSKTYERTNWLYLRLTMIFLGFSISIVSWIIDHVTSIIFTLLINGASSTLFKPPRSLRQGSIITLFFLLVVEGLCREVMDVKRKGSIQGIKIRFVF